MKRFLLLVVIFALMLPMFFTASGGQRSTYTDLTAVPNYFLTALTGAEPDNSAAEMIVRTGGMHISKEVTITGTGTVNANVLQLTGTVRILNQWALITEVTTLTNLTNAYAALYDGTNTVQLTSDGMTLSGAPVGTFFLKDKITSEPYSVSIADQCRVLETTTDREAGYPFTITQKNGADTFVQFRFTTTDAPVRFKVEIHFEYTPMDGGTLAFL